MKADPSLEKNEKALQGLLSQSSDFKTSDFAAGDRRYRLFYLDTMIELAVVQDHIIRPLLRHTDVTVREAVSILDYSETELLSVASKALVEGKTVLQFYGEAKFYLLGTELKKERSINTPVNERVLRGSNEALIENLDTNINLMRKLITTPDLAVKHYQLGRRSNTKVAVLYLNSLANKDVLKEFDRRIGRIDIDYVEAPGFLQELIQDKKNSLFPQILVSERTDRVRSYLMDGKIAILADGSPDCLIVPVSFWAFFQSPDDYQIGWLIGSTFRFLRIVCFIIAISLPGAYVALVTFDPRIIPFEIALTLQSSMQYIAMPAVLEAIFMLVTLEILREATVRLANPVGQTIGVVGGVVIGTVVVQSNLISTMMVVVVAFTAISSFVIPAYEMRSAARLLSYPFIVLSAIFGLIGLVLSFMLVLTHLARLNTMGIPYFYSGLSSDTIKDTFLRGPLGSLKKRSKESLAQDETRIRDPRGWTK
ncbi:spore germination protein [Paenibacillus filicis]|uniref:Spore germination protein n=1 Tax=Paenibacillus gyeongsangnamensis TaxID=3388067 RepID=A0ABT4QLQ2_9BACL|nr:spore germination protein [Paenibacillus filicis]MCZ8517769.1 spore germination protein [Paenibacillus filicis]